ncbi:hypothetical protein [Photobacterium leiognathi]|uniref:hypothetical protein n=1 Tax=Photobacterium leiognathi TaxID=553611 RepID=UPI002738E11A|nr:hypothetical protein [Photobacterium leiognathi]
MLFLKASTVFEEAEVSTRNPVRPARQFLLFAIPVVIHDSLMFGFPKLIFVKKQLPSESFVCDHQAILSQQYSPI